MRNWSEEYEALQSGDKAPEDFTTAELFDMAQVKVLGDNGWEAKSEILGYIEKHPDASDDDKVRVLTFRGDWIRRQGDPAAGLELLLAIPEPDGNMARAELLQAVSECYLALGELEEAREHKTAIMDLIFREGERVIPVDKELYHLGGVIEVMTQINPADPVVGDLLERFRRSFDDPDLQGPGRAYAVGRYFSLLGERYAEQGDWAEAAKAFIAWQVAAEYGGTKAVAAMSYLYAVWQVNPEDRELITMAMMEYFREHQNALLPTYISRYREEYDFVQGVLNRL